MSGPDWTERFWAKVDKNGPAPAHRPDLGPCWTWTATKTPSGYGMFRLHGRMQPAHRLSYEAQADPIPPGFETDHLCRNRACVNPAHLEPVTHRENDLRGVSFSAENARKTHCPQGHAYDEGNTWMDKGRRRCKTCKRAAWRRWNAAGSQKVVAA